MSFWQLPNYQQIRHLLFSHFQLIVCLRFLAMAGEIHHLLLILDLLWNWWIGWLGLPPCQGHFFQIPRRKFVLLLKQTITTFSNLFPPRYLKMPPPITIDYFRQIRLSYLIIKLENIYKVNEASNLIQEAISF